MMKDVKLCPKCEHENPADTNFCGKCAASLDDAPGGSDMPFTKTIQTPGGTQKRGSGQPSGKTLPLGTMFAGRYQIIEELGRGGMGQVYKVLDTHIDERIALKILLPGISEDTSTIERFSNELKIARQITHKNVCRMYHFGRDGDHHYITMEYVSGENLKSFIKRSGQLTVGKAVFIGLQICDGLDEAHKLGVVHRDLKPHNIIIDEEGNAKVMDFGIARSLKTRGITGTGSVIGTPEYMSPEQAEGGEVDPRSDIYSLGVILFEMVTGTPPFDGETALSVAMKHKSEPPPNPKSFNEDIPAGLNRLILKCLEKDKAKRYQTVRDLRSELESIQTEAPSAKRKVALTETLTTKEFTVRFSLKKLLKPAAALLALAAAVFLASQIALKKREQISSQETLPSIAVIGFTNETGDASLDYLQRVIPNLLISSLEQSGQFRVATWERINDSLRQIGMTELSTIDRESGFLFSENEGIDAIVQGSYTKAGDLYVTDIKVLDVKTKDLIKSASSRGTGEDSILREQIDELSRSISEGIGLEKNLQKQNTSQIANVTTTSLEAYNFYLQGLEAEEKFYVQEARAAFKHALDLDPEFAIVHLYLAKVESGLGELEQAEGHLRRAWDLSVKATEKERLYIQAYYEGHLGEGIDKQRQVLEQLILNYPEEKRAHYELGLSLKQEDRRDAIECYNRALALDPNYGLALNQLAYSYVYLKEFDKAIPHFRKYAGLYPEDANPLDSLGEVYLWMGKLEESAAHFMRSLELKPDFMNSLKAGAYVYALMEDYGKSFELIKQLIEIAPSFSTKAEGHYFMGVLYYWIGNYDEALVEFRVVRELDTFDEFKTHTPRTLSLSKWIYLERGETEKALEAHEEWLEFYKNDEGEFDDYWNARRLNFLAFVDLADGRIEDVRDKVDRMKEYMPRITQSKNRLNLYILQLTGELLLREGKYDQVIESCREILPANSIPWNNSIFLLPMPVDVLARAHIEKKDWDEAISEYERLIAIDPEDPNDRFLITPSFHFELARLYERKDFKGKAIEEYEKFLDIMSSAGVSDTDTEAARLRLTDLKSQ